MLRKLSAILSLTSLLSFSLCFGYEYKISIVAVTKNDHDYLKEWIDYHLKVGVDHFYIYDNNDHDLTKKLLEPYIKQGIIDYILWPSKGFPKPFWLHCQPAAYLDCAKKAVGQSEWLAIIDTDEFILPMEGTSVKAILDKYYNNHCHIYVNWRLFGTSHILGGPKFPILPNLTRCAKLDYPGNTIGKSIVRPEIVYNITDPHLIHSHYACVNGSGDIWDGQYADKYLRINHYTFRDEYYFSTNKLPRWLNAEAEGLDPIKSEQVIRQFNIDYCEDECLKMLELLKKIE